MKQMQANSKRWLSVLMAIIMVCMNIGPMQAVFAEEYLDDLSTTTNSVVAEVPAQQPTEDTTTPSAPEEAAAQQPTKDTVAQQPSEDVTAQQSTEDATQQPAEEETAQQPTEDAAVQQPTEGTVAQQPIKDTAAQSTEDTAAQHTEDTAAQPTEDTVAQPTEDTAAQPTEDTAAQSTEDTAAQHTEDTTAQPTEDVATQQPTEDAVAQQPTEEEAAQLIIEAEPEIIVVKSVRAMAKASSGVTLNLGFGSSGNDKAYEDTSFTITWNKMDDADHYEVSVRDLTLDKLIYDHETVSKSKNKFTISSKYMIANHSYRVWVGAAVTGVEGFESSHQAQSEFVCYEWECSHQNGTYRDVTKKTYKSISDTQHKYTEYYNLRCNDCDDILESNLTEEGTDDHFLDSNGDCKLCDYTFSCDHSKTKIVIDNTGYAQKNETHHLYFETGHVVCKNALCQKVLEPYYDEEEEEHTFEDGVCSKCGYIKAEELSIVVARGMTNATAGENISASVTIKGGSGKYSIAWEVLYNGSAKYTTDYTMPSTYSYTTDKAGNWQFKVYVKDTKDNTELTATTDSIVVAEAVCDHAETHEELIETEYSIASDTNHEIKDYYKVVCSKCGDVINERFYKTRLEPHTLDDNGKCICGYTAPTEDCNHSESVEKPIDSYTEQYNEKWHYVVTVYQDECANCGVVLNERREVKNFEAHSYDAKGICTACGYAQPTEECDHAPTKTELSTSYEIVDAEYHRVTINYHYECACGQVNYDEPTTKNEQHKFINGVCNLCGYEQQKVININGAFAKDSYMMKAGGTLEVGLTASATNANLTRVTVNVDGSGNDRLASKEISGTSWNGNLTLDGTVAPLNTPGTYTIKLYAAVDAGDPNYAQVDIATLVVEEAENAISIDGAFAKSSYSMKAGGTLDVGLTASATNANLTRVTVNVDGSGNDRLASKEISGTSWNGNLTLDGTVAPLNMPGTYTIKLFVAVDAGNPNYAQVDTATLVVEEAEKAISIDGAFAKDSYTMKAGSTLDVGLTASATNANLTRVTVNVEGGGNDRLASKEISGTSWNGNLTLDGTVAPLNMPGTYTIKLYAAVDAGDPNYAQVDTATLVVEEAEEIPTISITSPSTNDQVSFEKNLSVVWTEVGKADHYEFSARYEDETDAFIFREKTKEKEYSVPAASLKSGKKLILWVGACDASRNVLNGTVQATVTVTVAENTTTISITSPSNNAEISFGKDLIVEWSAVKEADHYEFSARYDDETTPIIHRAPVKEEKYTIDAGQLKLGKKLNLWVGACDANGQVINGTVQASATVTIAVMGSPNVTIDLDELDMTAMWPAVDGAVRYVYSLKNTTDNVSIADHADAANRTITQKLQAGKEYRLAVGAVPAGVDDVANAGSCSWAEKTFNTMPAVVDFTVEPNPVMLGKEAIFKVYNQRAEKVKLIVDGVEYEEYDASSDPQIIKRAFSQSGSRSIQFKAFGGGVWGEPCAAVKLEVLPAGKVPDPVISNISAKEIILSDSRTIYWRIDGDEEDLGIDYYSVTLARMENGTWAPVYVVNTTDDQEASGGGIALNGLLSIPGNYRLMVIAVPYGEGMDSELTGRTSVEFGYRTVPDFSLNEIVNDETIGTPVTVKWNRPTWSNDPKMKPDKYVVWWYGPGMESGMAIEVSGDSSDTNFHLKHR